MARVADEAGRMTREEREAFLADVRVGVLAIDEPGRGPLALPVWYEYEGGDVLVHIDDGTRKAELLRAAGRATLTVQDETPPYKYVSVEGPATIQARTGDEVAFATRYLGAELGEWYARANPLTASSVTVQLHPEHWRTYDFAKLFT
jgi:nitroimidazol reductase NimA-like FMN-containing flavoprotein (pyridoxamine 5'-phosphate oxidase superfamily)